MMSAWMSGARLGTRGGAQESFENKAYLLGRVESGGRWSVLGKVDIEDNMWVIEIE